MGLSKTQKDIRTKTHKTPTILSVCQQDYYPKQKCREKHQSMVMEEICMFKTGTRPLYSNEVKRWGENLEVPTASHALVNEIIAHPLYNHVALAWSHGFLVYAKDQGLVGFLYSDATCTLQYIQKFQYSSKTKHKNDSKHRNKTQKSKNDSSESELITVVRWKIEKMWTLSRQGQMETV